MSKVAIVTDSVACLTNEQIEKYGIVVVPVKILFEEKIYRNGVDLAPSEAYQLLDKAPDYFSTSPSSPSDYIDIFRELAIKGQDILCITVSSKLSTVFNVANLAAEQVKQELPQSTIEIMDSNTATASQGFVALAAARASAKDNEISDVIKAAGIVRDQVHFLLVLETIQHAHRTGRVPKVATQVGSMLGVKPLLTISDGEVHLFGVVRTKQSGVKRLIETMKRKVGNQPVHVAVMHADIPEEGERLKQQVSAEFNCVELFLTEFSPIIGYSTGRGVLGLAFYTLPPE
jgi:DegV family protein with EDD domain